MGGSSAPPKDRLAASAGRVPACIRKQPTRPPSSPRPRTPARVTPPLRSGSSVPYRRWCHLRGRHGNLLGRYPPAFRAHPIHSPTASGIRPSRGQSSSKCREARFRAARWLSGSESVWVDDSATCCIEAPRSLRSPSLLAPALPGHLCSLDLPTFSRPSATGSPRPVARSALHPTRSAAGSRRPVTGRGPRSWSTASMVPHTRCVPGRSSSPQTPCGVRSCCGTRVSSDRPGALLDRPPMAAATVELDPALIARARAAPRALGRSMSCVHSMTRGILSRRHLAGPREPGTRLMGPR